MDLEEFEDDPDYEVKEVNSDDEADFDKINKK